MSEITDTRQQVYTDFENNGFAFSAVVTRHVRSGYDPTTGSKTEVTHTYDGYVIFKKTSAAKAIPKYYEIKEGDKMCLFAGNGFEPLVKDTITIDSKDYQVKMSLESSAGSDALFLLVIR